jgi:2'-5' RNA ligase
MPLYLIAILPPPEIDEQVMDFKQYMLRTFGCKVALNSPAHITLIPPFTIGKENVKGLLQDLKSFSENYQSFPIDLNGFQAFPPRVIFVHVNNNEILSGIKAALEEFLIVKNYPVKKETRPFHPHITIANRDLLKNDFPLAWKHFNAATFTKSFMSGKISLLEHDGNKWNTCWEYSFTNKNS